MIFLKNRIRPLITKDRLLSFVLSVFAISLFFGNNFILYATVLFIATAIPIIIHSTIIEKKKLTKPQLIVYCWLAVYLVRVVWLLMSNDIHYGLKWLDTCLPMLLFPIIIQYLSLSERIIKTVLTVFVHFALLFCTLSLLSVAYYSFTTPVDIKEWLLHPKNYYPLAFKWTNYAHPSFLCIIYLFALPVGLYLKRKYHTVSTTKIIILIVVEAAVIAFTGSRIGIIIFPLLLLLMLLYSVLWKRKIITAGLAIALISITAIILSLSENQFTDRFKDPIRTQLWETTLFSIKEKPLLGVGTGGMKAVLASSELAEKLDYPAQLASSYPHNQYLGEIMHFGIIGAIPLFATLIYLLIIAICRKNFLLLSLMVILFVFMITEMPFDLHKSINYFLFLTNLFMARNQASLPE
jgi:O-antigen ligase